MAVVASQLIGKVSIQGADQAKKDLSSVGVSADSLGNKLSSMKPFDVAKTISNEDAARAKLKLIELDVEKARTHLQKLEKAADAGQAVTGIDEARAKLTLLEKSAQDARKSLNQMVDEANRSSGILSLLNGVAGRVSSTLSRFGSMGKSALSGVASGFLGLGSSAMNALGSIGLAAEGIRSIVDAARGLATAFLSQNASLEQARVSFLAFLESNELVNKAMSDLRQFAAQTPFEFPEIQQASLKLLNMGVASQDLTKYLNNVGNAVSKVGGNGQILNETLIILNQMTMKGQIYAEEMQQLAERNIPAYKLLADAMGVTSAELQKMMQNGEVGADKVNLLIEAMGEFGNGAMQMQAKTFNGLLSTVKDNALMAWAAFTGPLFDQAKGGLEALGRVVSDPKFEEFATVMGEHVGGAIVKVGNFIQTNLTPFFKDLWVVLNDEPFGMLMVNLGNLGGAILDVVQAGSPLLNLFRDTEAESHGMSPAIASISTAMYNLSSFIDSTLVPILNDVSDFFGVIIPPASKVLQEAMDGVAGIIEKVRQPVSNLLDKLGPLIAGFFDWADKNNIVEIALGLVGDALVRVVENATSLVEGVQKVTQFFGENEVAANLLKVSLVAVGGALAGLKIQELVTGLPGLIAKIATWTAANWTLAVSAWAAAGPYVIIGALIALIIAGIILAIMNWGVVSKWLMDRWEEVKNFFIGLWGKIGEIFGAIGKWFQDRFTEARDKIFEVFGAIGGWFSDRFNDAKNKIFEIFNPIGQWFGDRWQDIQNIFAPVGNWFADRFNEAKQGTQNAFQNIGTWFSDRWNEISTVTEPLRDYIGQVFRTIWNIIVALFRIAGRWFGDRFNEVRDAIMAALGFLGQWFQDRWNEIVRIFAPVGQWFADRFNEAKAKIVEIFTPIVRWFQDRWAEITKIFSIVGQWFADRFNEARTSVTRAFESVGRWFQDRFNEAKQGVVNAFGSIGQWFSDRWAQIKQGVIDAWGAISRTISEKANQIKEGILKPFNDAKNAIGGILKGLANAAIDQLNNGIGAFESFLNFFGDALNGIAETLGTEGVIEKVVLSRIPKLAEGTDFHPGGPAVIGEAGRELAMINGKPMVFDGPQLVNLPRGATVLPNKETEMALSLIPRGLIPGYEGGIGEAWTQFWAWVASGAQSVLDNVLNAMGIKGFSLPGKLNELPGAVFGKVKNWAVDLISGWMPKIDLSFGSSEQASGDLKSWIAQAIAITKTPGNWANSLIQIALHESGGNPTATNNWDINAQNGDPSRGLMQTIGATFRAYALPGYGDIFNPVHNTIAAIRYIQSRYGDVFSVPGIVALSQGRPYVGYANGGIINEMIAGIGLRTGTRYTFGERGPEEVRPLGGMGYMPPGTGAVPFGGGGSGTPIIVNVNVAPELCIDGYKMGSVLTPYITERIRYATGARF